jgi:hypothetical protein
VSNIISPLNLHSSSNYFAAFPNQIEIPASHVQDFALAQRHFTRADPQLATGENIAMLQSWMSDVAPAELDLLVARTVLQVSYRIVGSGVFECILHEQNEVNFIIFS